MTGKDLRLLLSAKRQEAVKNLEYAQKNGLSAKTDTELSKIRNYDSMAEQGGWRYCERCDSYEEYDDDKCKRCGAPLYRYEARG